MNAPSALTRRRAAAAARLKAAAGAAPQRPVFRSGVDIDAVHYRQRGIVAEAIASRSPLERAMAGEEAAA